jgi:hypothetical protein
MKFQVSSALEYEVRSPSTLILSIHALRTPTQAVIEEAFTTEPYIKMEELTSANGENRFARLEVSEKTSLTIAYKATVDTQYKVIEQAQLGGRTRRAVGWGGDPFPVSQPVLSVR